MTSCKFASQGWKRLSLTVGSPGLPKKTQTYFFFQIDHVRVKEFRSELTNLIPLISSSASVHDDHVKIAQHKTDIANGKIRQGQLLQMSHVNICFSKKGLDVVCCPLYLLS